MTLRESLVRSFAPGTHLAASRAHRTSGHGYATSTTNETAPARGEEARAMRLEVRTSWERDGNG